MTEEKVETVTDDNVETIVADRSDDETPQTINTRFDWTNQNEVQNQ